MNDDTCRASDCDRPVAYRTLQLCRRCYKRWLAHGTAERLKPVLARFEERLSLAPSGCWLWTGGLDLKGYGIFSTNDGKVRAHRWSYEHHVAEIPEGLVIDHLCRTRSCVNPWHLEPVPAEVNTSRGLYGSRSHCEKGHEYTPENTYIRTARGNSRVCRECDNARRRKAA